MLQRVSKVPLLVMVCVLFYGFSMNAMNIIQKNDVLEENIMINGEVKPVVSLLNYNASVTLDLGRNYENQATLEVTWKSHHNNNSKAELTLFYSSVNGNFKPFTQSLINEGNEFLKSLIRLPEHTRYVQISIENPLDNAIMVREAKIITSKSTETKSLVNNSSDCSETNVVFNTSQLNQLFQGVKFFWICQKRFYSYNMLTQFSLTLDERFFGLHLNRNDDFIFTKPHDVIRPPPPPV